MIDRTVIDQQIDLSIPEIKQMYNSWDKGDCSLVGLCKILLIQSILEHKIQNDVYYDTDVDEIYNKLLK